MVVLIHKSMWLCWHSNKNIKKGPQHNLKERRKEAREETWAND